MRYTVWIKTEQHGVVDFQSDTNLNGYELKKRCIELVDGGKWKPSGGIDVEVREFDTTEHLELVKMLPFETVINGTEKLDCALWRCQQNVCELQHDSACDTSGFYYGTSDSHEPKFCARHFYPNNLGDGIDDYKLVDKKTYEKKYLVYWGEEYGGVPKHTHDIKDFSYFTEALGYSWRDRDAIDELDEVGKTITVSDRTGKHLVTLVEMKEVETKL